MHSSVSQLDRYGTNDIPVISWCICRRYHLRCILVISNIFFRFFDIFYSEYYVGFRCSASFAGYGCIISVHHVVHRHYIIIALPLKAEIVRVPNLSKGGAARRVATAKVGGNLQPTAFIVLRRFRAVGSGLLLVARATEETFFLPLRADGAVQHLS